MENSTHIKERNRSTDRGSLSYGNIIREKKKTQFFFPNQKFVIQTPAKAIQEVQNIFAMVSWIFKLSHWEEDSEP